MTIVDKLEQAVSKMQSIFDSGLSRPCKRADDQECRYSLVDASEALQDLYNLIDTALGLLKGYHKEDTRFLAGLEYEILGRKQAEQFGLRLHGPSFVETNGNSGSPPYHWYFKQTVNPEGGIFVVMEFLRRSMGFGHGSKHYAVNIRSAFQAFQQTVGTIKRLQSRLNYTVMYPDTISKDALQVRENLKKHDLEEIWQEFNAGMDNFRMGDLLGSTNRITNALRFFLRAAALMYGYKGGQLGEHSLFLEKIDFIHDYVRQMMSSYFGYLSKFRKGVEPSLDEARLLLDLAFSLFGFLVPRLDSFSISEEKTRDAKKKTKALVKKRKREEAKKTLLKEKG